MPQIGFLLGPPGDFILDVVRDGGVDFVWLDAEHTDLSPTQCAQVVRNIAATCIRVLVRVPRLDRDTLITYANTGVDEIVLPRVRTPVDLEEAWSALNYPPQGTRPRQIVPASRYGQDWSMSPALSTIIETVDAVENLDRFVDFSGLDGVWIGPRDLADDYRLARPEESIDIDLLVAELVERLSETSLLLGLGAGDADGVVKVLNSGVDRCVIYLEPYVQRCVDRILTAAREKGDTS